MILRYQVIVPSATGSFRAVESTTAGPAPVPDGPGSGRGRYATAAVNHPVSRCGPFGKNTKGHEDHLGEVRALRESPRRIPLRQRAMRRSGAAGRYARA